MRYRKTQAKDLKLRLKTLEAEIDMIHADQHRNKAGILEDVKGLEQAVKLKARAMINLFTYFCAMIILFSSVFAPRYIILTTTVIV